jgi:uncharacterized protein
MTPQERDLLTTLLARLKNTAGQPKDPEADALIRQALNAQPDSPYYLAQTVLIQDLSLHNAQSRIGELERQLSDAQQQAVQPAHTSFLGSLFGSRSPQPQQPLPPSGSVPPAGPWTRSPQVAAAAPAQQYQQQPYPPQGGYAPQGGYPPGGGFMGGGGSGFLRSAAATAAGVAGGALLFQGIESLFGRHESAGIIGGQQMTPGLGETVVNNYYGDQNQDFSGGSFDPGANQDFSGGGNFDPGGNQDLTGGSFDPNAGGYGGDQDLGGGDQDFGGGDQDFGGGGDFNNQC